jgi:hypothetical protein
MNAYTQNKKEKRAWLFFFSRVGNGTLAGM